MLMVRRARVKSLVRQAEQMVEAAEEIAHSGDVIVVDDIASQLMNVVFKWGGAGKRTPE